MRVTSLMILVITGCLLPSIAFAQSKVIDLPTNIDKSRDRNIPVTFHLPDSKERQPLVLVTHGGGASRHGMYALAAELARSDYVVMCLEHIGSNTDEIRRRMQSEGIGLRAAQMASGQDMRERKNRPLDVKFAIDLAEQLNRQDARFKDRIDLSEIAIMGHSYGAFTAMVCCGAKPVGLKDELRDPRIKIGIGFSPLSANGNFFDQKSFSEVNGPFVGISGTQDVAGNGHRDFFKLMPKGDKHLLWFHDATHLSFSDPTGGPRSLPNPDTDVTHALGVIVPGIVDTYLRGEPALDETVRKDLIQKSLRGRVHQIDWDVN